MQFFDVQITTDMGEVVVVQVAAGDRQEAEMTAISMVESGYAEINDNYMWLFLTRIIMNFT